MFQTKFRASANQVRAWSATDDHVHDCNHAVRPDVRIAFLHSGGKMLHAVCIEKVGVWFVVRHHKRMVIDATGPQNDCSGC